MLPPHSIWRSHVNQHWRKLWLLTALALYLMLSTYQLGLPGLHYDEAREAGVNAMELLTGAPVTAFRGVTVTLFGWHLPVMVQDYIGALNVYLVLPLLWLTGIGVPNVRVLGVLTGLAALVMLERAISEWSARATSGTASGRGLACPFGDNPHSPTSISLAALLTLTLLAASPSFVFWSRQGIFVTNLTQPLSFCCIWQGLHWLRSGRVRALVFSALAAGLALYAKLLAIWVIGPFALLMSSWWLWQHFVHKKTTPTLSLPTILGACLAFVLPLLPLLFFYEQTGALGELFHKLDQSYYGVNNRDLLDNLVIRWHELGQSVRGDHLWYLGGVYGNNSAPWLAGIAILVGLWRQWQKVAAPLVFLALVFACSLFTISDLFVTHYALVQPLVVAVVGIGLSCWNAECGMRNAEWTLHSAFRIPHSALLCLLLLWFGLDLNATLHYQAALSQSGGLADHSDATYHLAYYLRYQGIGAPIALDWGIDAPVRYLSQGAVTPIEIFGYTSPHQPDAAFAQRLRLFLMNPNNIYLLHATDQAIFSGRREVFIQMAKAAGLTLLQEQKFRQRDGTVLFEVWRATP